MDLRISRWMLSNLEYTTFPSKDLKLNTLLEEDKAFSEVYKMQDFKLG